MGFAYQKGTKGCSDGNVDLIVELKWNFEIDCGKFSNIY